MKRTTNTTPTTNEHRLGRLAILKARALAISDELQALADRQPDRPASFADDWWPAVRDVEDAAHSIADLADALAARAI